MNEKEVEGINFEADENGQAADSIKPETATSDEERKQEEQIAGPVKRGRGRPPKNQKSEQAEAANSEAFAEAAETMQGIHVSDSSEAEQEDSPDPERTDVAYREKPPVQDFILASRGMQLLTELVRSQNQSQEKLIRSQTEFSSSVMDRMDQYRMLNEPVSPAREPSDDRNAADRKEEERNWWEEDTEPDRQEDYEEDRDDGDYDEDYDEEYEEGRTLSDEIPLLVLTTQSMVHGAAAVFIPEVMEQISKKMPEGFFILPSSIHEVMVLPKTLGASIEALDEMVSSINEMQVDPEDQLSDFAHVYDPDRKILLCPGAPELNKEKTPEKEQELDPNVIR